MSEINEAIQTTGLEIAVIGMSARFPGTGNIDEYWENLKNGVESITFSSDKELKRSNLPGELIEDSNYIKSKGGVLEGSERFDAAFFGYTPAEAQLMDPQMRVFHECVWQALENAGCSPDNYDGLIGIYAGSSSNFYWEALALSSGKGSEFGEFAAGQLMCRDFLATLVSYKLNLKGPSYTVLTACSTSLVAIHIACQAILNGECHIALAGGVTVKSDESPGYLFREGMIMSPDGHCRAFDSKAQGTVGGNGVGVVVLKALEDALADRDYIHALVKGTAVNNDGLRKGGYSAPSIEGQAEAIGTALQVAEVDPQTIDYVETHGTGTSLGDPIEIAALKLAFDTEKRNYCAIGSVKTNIGHLDAAAGVAGFIKTVLVLKHHLIPPTLHFEQPNPRIDFKNSPFYVNAALSKLESNHPPLRAGVSSFGIGGTNAHAILEEWPHSRSAIAGTPQRGQHWQDYQLIPVSAKTGTALEKITKNLVQYLRKHPEANLEDIAYTLQMGRKAMTHRRMLVCSTIDEAVKALDLPGDHLQSGLAETGVRSSPAIGEDPSLIFMFPGQGSQYLNMGIDLYRTEVFFREEIDRCAELLKPLMGCDIRGIIYPEGIRDPGKINQTQFAQPALFVFEYALAKLLMKWGIVPYAMMGHSIGEYVAAHLAGVFSLQDALELVTLRGRLMQKLPAGSMLSVPMGQEQLQALLDDREDKAFAVTAETQPKGKKLLRQDISTAAVNTPAGCVVSGSPQAIGVLEKELQEKGYETRRLHTSHAFHSPMMGPIIKEFKEAVARFTRQAPQIPFISNVSGTWISLKEAVDPDYWAMHLRKTVLFSKGVRELLQQETVIFLEVGPGKVLSTFVNQQPARKADQVAINLVRHPQENKADHQYLVEKLGLLWLYGKDIDWNQYHKEEKKYRLPLPEYPFEGKRFWLESNSLQLRNQAKEAANLKPSSGTTAPDNLNERPKLRTGYAAPGNETEKTLVKIWQKFFGINKIGIGDDFFELGGDSLKATTLTNIIHKEMKVKVPVSEIFNRPVLKKLARFIEACETTIYDAIEPVEARDYYALSSAQARLFFLEHFEDIGTSYNMPYALIIKGAPDKARLREVVRELLRRHEALRTSFTMFHDEPVQIIRHSSHIDLDIEEIQISNENLCKENLEQTINDFIQPFDLATAPLMRIKLLSLAPAEYLLLFDMHHIIGDGTSLGILTYEFITLYAGRELAPLNISYQDFAVWQNQLFASGKIKAQEDYWLDLYSDLEEIPRLNLPYDYPRPPIFSFKGGNYIFKLDNQETSIFKERILKENGATLFIGLLAVFSLLLYKYTDQSDIVVGSGIAGRHHADLQGIIGMFVNSLSIRNYIHRHMTFRELVKEVKKNSLLAFENQDAQFEDIVNKLNIERDMSRNPIFDVSIVVQNFERPIRKVENISFVPYDYENKTSKFDITLFVYETGENVQFLLEYCTSLFKLGTIQRLSRHFIHILKQVSREPDKWVSALEIITKEELQMVLMEFNSTSRQFPGDKTIHGIFAEQVNKTPDHVALVEPIPKQASITYRELHEGADQIARYLCLQKGVKPGEPVGIWMSPLLMRPVAVLGVLKAGGTYVPLEPSLPRQRLKYMICDTNINIVISEKRYLKDLNGLQWECDCFNSYLCIDSEDIRSESEVEANELMDVELWHHVGETANDDISAGGWVSSFTGKPFSREEMDEYGSNILAKLQPLFHSKMRVLEIGCASGITMYRIAPKVASYYGTDLSNVIISKNKKKIKQEGHQNIKLKALAAHEIHQIANQEPNFHLIIINSVIQCFPGHNYLGKVIKQAIDLLEEKGYLFIGDIMDLQKKELLVRDLEAFKRDNRDRGYTTKTDFSSELFVSRGFWEDIRIEYNQIEAIEFSDKIYTIENELTKFRYDVLITVNKRSPPVKKDRKRKRQDDVRCLTSPAPGGQSGFSPGLHSQDPAYIIYTSGSTGLPKGVMIRHRSVLNLCYWHWKNYEVTAADHATLYADFGFDASVWELFPYLLSGAVLYIVDRSLRPDIEKLHRFFRRCHITIAFLPTQLCEQFMSLDNNSDSLRVLLTGGDKLRTFTPGGYRLYNNYGPTENTVVTTAYPVKFPSHNIPIGKPINNTRIYILNKQLQLQPVGVAGELCIAGEGLAMGYLNRPELTAEKFFSDYYRSYRSYMTYISNKIYKTGDLACWLPNGDIQFLERIDHQVKVRGFRIELGEIETRMLRHENITKAVVTAKEDGEGDKMLCAYYTGKEVPAGELRTYLEAGLPAYMIPSFFVYLEQLPLTTSGKINNSALPGPGVKRKGKDDALACSEVEKKLSVIWADVLKIEKTAIGTGDNFFEVGGHSLKAALLATKIRKEFEVEFPLSTIFRSPTIKEIAAVIKSKEKSIYEGIKPVEKMDYYPQSSAQKRIFFFEHFDNIGTGYNTPTAIGLKGKTGKKQLEKIINRMIKRHEILRTSFTMVGNLPVQILHHHKEIKVEDLRVESRENSKKNTDQIIRDFIRPFDLSQAPLLRMGFLTFNPGEHLFVFDMHHIINDGASMTILINEFMSLYSGTKPVPPRIHYKDYSVWQVNLLESGGNQEQLNYWLRRFSDLEEIPRLNLPLDYPRPELFSFEGAFYESRLGREDTVKFKRLVKGTTIFIGLLAILNLFLYKYTGQPDIIIGYGIDGRNHADLQHIIGMFGNSLPIWNYVDESKSCLEFLNEVKEVSINAFENQDVQFEDLVDQLNPVRNPSRGPIFDVFFLVQHFERSVNKMGDIDISTIRYEKNTSRFDIALIAGEENGGISFIWTYCTALFKRETIERLSAGFLNILHQVITGPEMPISALEVPMDRDAPSRPVSAGIPKAAPGSGSELEKKLLEKWSQVLERPKNDIAIDNNFFDLGGNSLKAVALAEKIRNELGIKVPLLRIFKKPTVKELARYIARTASRRRCKPG